MPPVPKRRTSTYRTGKRRAALKRPRATVGKCPHCGQPKEPHVRCKNCGKY